MRNLHRWVSSFAVAVLVASVGLYLLPAAPAYAQAVPRHESIVLLDGTGKVVVHDPLPTVHQVWTSAGDIGFTRVALGDFTGSFDNQIVAAGPGYLIMYDLAAAPGSQRVVVDWSTLPGSSLTSGSIPKLLATGDFDRDGRDEIAFVFASGAYEYLNLYQGTPDARAWTMVGQIGGWGGWWSDMATGDVNADGYADLAMVRQVDNRLSVYSGKDWSLLYDSTNFGAKWLAVGVGRISAAVPGLQLALTRQAGVSPDPNYQPNSELVFRWDFTSNTFVDMTPAGYFHYPYFFSLALGDLNGDGDDEIVILRDPGTNTGVSLIVLNPAGVPVPALQQGLGRTYKSVRTGDINGDGKDEIIVLAGDRYLIYRNPTGNPDDVQTIFASGSSTSFYTSNFTDEPTFAVGVVGWPLGRRAYLSMIRR